MASSITRGRSGSQPRRVLQHRGGATTLAVDRMKKLLLPALVLLPLVLAGCLELDGQEVTIRYDAEADRIDVLLVYRGLFAEGGQGSSSDPLDKAMKDLADARETGEFVFWNNWPLSVDLSRDIKPPMKALADHVDVENGDLFTDPQGVLCAYQFVRIRDAKAFVQKVNLLLEVALQTGFSGEGLRGSEGRHTLDDDTRELVRDFLRSGEKLFVLEPGRVELRLPFSQQDHAWVKAQLEDHFMDNMPREIVRRRSVAERRAAGGAVADTTASEATVNVPGEALRADIARAPSFRFFWDNDLSILRELELTTIGIGVAGQEQLRVDRAMGGLYHDALLKKLRADGVEIEDGLPDQELTRRFEQFRGREANLPPKVAALRG
jgi:hypothetical protein